MRITYLLGGILSVSVFAVSAQKAEAGNTRECWIGTISASDICPPPPAIAGKVKSTKRFKRECVWLPFPVGPVGEPVVFFTRESDARCIGRNWRRDCPECTAWIQPDRPRVPVNGPAANAVVALRLHNGLGGVSVPRDAVARIKADAAWCWLGKSGVYDSHGFSEKPF